MRSAMWRLLWTVAALGLSVEVVGRAQAGIIVEAAGRQVQFAGNGPGSNSDTSSAVGIYNNSVSGSFGGFTLTASQNTTTPTPSGTSIFGTGGAQFEAHLTTSPSRANGNASTSFSVFFTVDVTEDYLLTDTLFGSRNGPVTGNTQFSLRDGGSLNGYLVLDESSYSGISTFSRTISLAAGHSYSLNFDSLVTGDVPGPFEGTITTEVTFDLHAATVPVNVTPEPATLSIVAPAALAGIIHAWRRRRRNRASEVPSPDLS